MDAQAMEAIYNRLHSVTYTPLSADTFGDWTIEAGDVLTVSKDGTSYQTPVMHSTLRWTGGSSVYIESTGNKEREPLNAQSKQAYENGYGGYYAGRYQNGLNLAFQDEFGYMRSYIDMTEEHLWLAFENDLSCTRSELLMTSESLRIAFENEISCTRSELLMTSESLRIAFENEISCTRSEFQMTSESLRISFENDIASTRSEFEMTAESLRTNFENEIDGMSSQIEQNASQIALKVNRGDVATQLAVEAGNVTVQGGNLVVEGMITAENIQASIADLSVLNVKAISASGNITSSNGVVMAPYFYLGTSGNARSLANAITALRLQQNGDQYTLQKQDFDDATWVDVGTFNRASGSSKVSGTWTGGTYTVVADANGQDLPISMSINSVLAYDAVTYSNGLLNVPIKVTAAIGSGSAEDTGYTQDFKVVPTAAMQAVNVSGQWDGTSGKFTAVSSSNNAKKVETTIASVLAYDTVTYSNGFLTVPLKVTAAVGSGSASDTGYTQAFKVTAAPAMQAVDVNGNWDSGAFTATSSANSNKKVITTIDNVSASGTVTYSNGLLNIPLQVLAKINGGNQTNTGYTQSLSVTAAPAMQAVDVSGSWDGTSGKFTAVSSSNSAKKSETTITSVLADGTVTYADGLLNVPIKVMAKVGTGSATDTGYTQDFKVSGTAAYTAGQDDLKNAGGSVRKTTNDTWTLNQYVTTLTVAVPTSNITGLAIDTTNHQIKTSTSSTDQSVTITCEKVTRSYTTSSNTYVQVFQSKADSSVIATVNDSFVATEAYNAGRDSMFLYQGGTGSNGPLWPGNYALREGGASGTIHASWTLPNPWLYIVSSGTPQQGTLGYDTLIQTGCESGGTIVLTPGAIWKTPPVPTLEMSTAGATVTARMMNGTTELGSDSRTVSTSLGFSFAGPFNNTTTMRAEMGWASGAGTNKGTLTSAKYYAIEASAGGTKQQIYFRTP